MQGHAFGVLMFAPDFLQLQVWPWNKKRLDSTYPARNSMSQLSGFSAVKALAQKGQSPEENDSCKKKRAT